MMRLASIARHQVKWLDFLNMIMSCEDVPKPPKVEGGNHEHVDEGTLCPKSTPGPASGAGRVGLRAGLVVVLYAQLMWTHSERLL